MYVCIPETNIRIYHNHYYTFIKSLLYHTCHVLDTRDERLDEIRLLTHGSNQSSASYDRRGI